MIFHTQPAHLWHVEGPCQLWVPCHQVPESCLCCCLIAVVALQGQLTLGYLQGGGGVGVGQSGCGEGLQGLLQVKAPCQGNSPPAHIQLCTAVQGRAAWSHCSCRVPIQHMPRCCFLW
jgi:hypothetical protein